MRGSLLICEVQLVFRGVLVITLVRSIAMTDWQLDLEEGDCF